MLCPRGQQSSWSHRWQQSKCANSKLYEFVRAVATQPGQQVMPDDHSKVVPLLPIPNRTVKRLRADDSADSRVKVGHRQAITAPNSPSTSVTGGFGVIRVGVSHVDTQLKNLARD